MTQAPPLVSVVMIFLNGEKYIEEAIASVEAQTWPHWELILVDDGSTDGATRIARERAARDPARIRYLEHEGHANLGMSAARNAGFARATGKYVALLDADDVWTPEKLERQTAILEARPEAAMLYGPALNWFSWSADPAAQADYVQYLGVPDGYLARPPELVAYYLEHPARTPGTGTLLARREALGRVGGFVEQFRGMFEDQAFYLKLALEETILVSGEAWLRYRQHPESCCTTGLRPEAYREARGRFLDWAAEYLAMKGTADARIRRAMKLERAKLAPKSALAAGSKSILRAFIPAAARRWIRARLARPQPWETR